MAGFVTEVGKLLLLVGASSTEMVLLARVNVEVAEVSIMAMEELLRK